MEKPTILLIEEMRQKVADVANEYISQVPAVTMADFFGTLATQFQGVARQQLIQAQAEYNKANESEVKEDGGTGQKSNRTTGNE